MKETNSCCIMYSKIFTSWIGMWNPVDRLQYLLINKGKQQTHFLKPGIMYFSSVTVHVGQFHLMYLHY